MKKDCFLIVLAAGMGTRYGGHKQIDAFGPNGETIIEYSIYDAIYAGFNKIVFILSEGMESVFLKKFKPIVERVETYFICQTTESLPIDFPISVKRKKPWGTAHAVYMCKDVVDAPFAIINADDFYGRKALKSIFSHLTELETSPLSSVLVGYQLQNTLSPYGTVSRGVCNIKENHILESITERVKITRDPLTGNIFYQEKDKKIQLEKDTIVSLNLMGFTPKVFPLIEEEFKKFYFNKENLLKKEFFIPIILERMVREGIDIPVLFTDEEWFGVTYKEDKPFVKQKIKEIIENGVYPKKLWE